MTGRVYRVAPRGHKPSVPKVNPTTAAGCVEALKSPNLATRYLAWTKLHAWQDTAADELRKLWRNDPNPRFRARALQLLARIKGAEKRHVEEAVRDSNPDLRSTGLRIARSLKLDLIPYLKTLAHDSAPQVRRECAIALRHHPSAEAPALWAALAQQHDGKDRWYLEALGIGADRQWDRFLEAWLASTGPNWNTPAGRDIIWRSRAKKTPSMLAQIIHDKRISESERPRYFRSLDFIQGPEKEAALVELLTSAAQGK